MQRCPLLELCFIHLNVSESSQAVVETQTASHLRIDDVSGCREEDSAIASTTEAPPSAVTPDDATDDEDVIEGTPPRPICKINAF